MTEIFGKLAVSGAIGVLIWFLSFLLGIPIGGAIEILNEKIANILFVIYLFLLPISLIVLFIGLIGWVWTV